MSARPTCEECIDDELEQEMDYIREALASLRGEDEEPEYIEFSFIRSIRQISGQYSGPLCKDLIVSVQ
jgi:hypothetical protein